MTVFEDLGWRQGAVLSDALLRRLIPGEGLEQSGRIAVVLSQDCDVTNGCLEREPTLEVLLAKRVSVVDGNLTFGKNSRKIQFECGEEIFEATMQDRHYLDRSPLSSESPSPRKLQPQTVDVLSRWIALRYTRAAFPTAFNVRISGRVEQIRRVLKRGPLVSAVFLGLSPHELGPEEAYNLELIGTFVAEEDDLVQRTQAIEIVDELRAEFVRCSGVTVDCHDARSEADFSLADLRRYKRWDADYLTDRSPSAAVRALRD